MPKLSMPGAVLVGDAGGMVDTVALKGVHHCIKSGILAAEAIYASLKGEQALSPTRTRSRTPDRPGALPGPQHPPAVSKGSSRARRWSTWRSPPRASSRRAAWSGTATTSSRCSSATRGALPKPDGKYTFDKLSSVYISGNATRDDAPNHIRVHKHVPREIAETWAGCARPGCTRSPRTLRNRAGGRDRQLHQLRAVRRDHRQGRPADPARGRRRAAVPADVARWARGNFRPRAAVIDLRASLSARLFPTRTRAPRPCSGLPSPPPRRRPAARSTARLPVASGPCSPPPERSASPASCAR